MADVQLEDGHVRIANALWRELYSRRLSVGELQVMMAMIRLTWGFQKKSDKISAGQIATETGLSRARSHAIMLTLLRSKMLGREEFGPRRMSRWWVEKDFDQWLKLSRHSKTDDRTQSVPPVQDRLSPPSKTELSPPSKHTKDKRHTTKTRGQTGPLTALPDLDSKWVALRCLPENNPTGRAVLEGKFRIWLAWAWHTQGMRDSGYTSRGFKRGVSKWWGGMDRFRRDGQPSDLTKACEWFERLTAQAERAARAESEPTTTPSAPISSEDLAAAQELFV